MTRTASWRWWWALLVFALALVGCDGDETSATRDASVDVLRWECPATWVAYARGGCGPGVLLCAPDGGAAPGACDGVDVRHPHDTRDEDGGVVPGFFLDEQGALQGGWRAPGAPDGPPAAEWQPSRVPVDVDGGAPEAPGIPHCPAGWARTDDGVCDPDLPTDCPVGSGALPGHACTRTSERACPDGDYAPPPPESVGARVVYVRAGASASMANGTEARPFASITAGIAGAGPRGWVFVAAGTYPEQPRVTASVHVVGVCAARVIVAAPDATRRSFQASRMGVSLDLRGVSVRGGTGLAVILGAHATLDAVRVTDVTELGLQIDGAGTQVTATDLLVQRVALAPSTVGYGVEVSGGASLVASLVHVSDTVNAGVAAVGADASLALDDAVLRAVRQQGVDGQGAGAWAVRRGALRLRRVAVEDTAAAGVAATGEAATADVVDAVVRRVRGGTGTTVGLSTRMGATLRAERVRVEDVDGRGIAAFEGATLEFRDGVVRDIHESAPGVGGYGAHASAGAVRVTGAVIQDCAAVGALASLDGGALTLDDSVVRQTVPSARPTYGMTAQDAARLTARGTRVEGPFHLGVFATRQGALALDGAVVGPMTSETKRQAVATELGATMTLSRVHLAACVGTALFVGSDSMVTADALAVTGTRTPSTHEPDVEGRAVDVEHGGALTASRVWIADTQGIGVFVADGGSVSLRGAAVRDGRAGSDADGQAVRLQSGGRLDARGVLLASCEGAAVLAGTASTQARCDDVIVRDVRTDGTGQGYGLVAYVGASLDARRVAVLDTRGAAVSAAYSVGRPDFVARVTATDLFVRGVTPGRDLIHPERTAPYAYGIHSATTCVVRCARAVVDDGVWGFFQSAGELRLAQTVITRQREAAGASNGASDALPLVLDAVQWWGNARDAVLRDVMLPEVRVELPDLAP